MSIEPSALPTQAGSITAMGVIFIAEGCKISMESTAVQLNASVMVTVYMPAKRLLMVVEFPTPLTAFDHVNE